VIYPTCCPQSQDGHLRGAGCEATTSLWLTSRAEKSLLGTGAPPPPPLPNVLGAATMGSVLGTSRSSQYEERQET
jgi:hypothetical protein